ncbi:probable glycosyltransferase STELLO2 [Asterias rubens]|uniref:probable glycosyltransferase STELLO2 n=1 Tax=Asterias rubens TaxID=7604 RepID=UPI0014553AFF|nr:probable glycosyltransferase STELLO2 [Asterias rubens]XP_033632605.1 probable glycosyltransferase STELLO2 [Asterias rubens]
MAKSAFSCTPVHVFTAVSCAVICYFTLRGLVNDLQAMLPTREVKTQQQLIGATGNVHKLEKIRTFHGKRSVEPAGSYTPSWSQNKQCDRWIVVTTIFEPTGIMKTLGATSGWCMVVVADKKGPVSMDIPNIVHLTVAEQKNCRYRICQLIPWNHFSRKNIGYMYAIEHGAKVIYDTDDDNGLLADLMPDFEVHFAQHVKLDSYVWNPYPEFGPSTHIWPRGFPLNRITDDTTKSLTLVGAAKGEDIGVVQYLAQHDPDVDAIYRMTYDLPYDFNLEPKRFVLPPRVLSPYNAQTTHHSQDAFWGMLLPITVHSRVSDIWRSYFTQRLLWDIGKRLSFHSPAVVQNRNAHNYLADFDSEMDLYYKADNLVKFLLGWTPSVTLASLEQRLFEMQIDLYEYGFIEAGDVALTEAWIQDLQSLGYVFPKVQTK